MDYIDGLGYVALGVINLDRAVDFFSQVCRLAVRDRTAAAAVLTGDQRQQWLVLEARPVTALARLGFRASVPQALVELPERLRAAGITVSGSAEEGAIHFRDPNGMEVEVYAEMPESSRSAIPAEVGLDILLHAVVNAPDPIATAVFYEDVVGFRRSDRIADLVVFLRAANGYHHSLAFAKGAEMKLDHLAILVNDLDALMRLRSHAMATGTLSDDIVRHTASGSMSVYLREEENGLGVEFCTGHMRIIDDAYRGRLLQPAPTTVNMWANPFPDTQWSRDLGAVRGAQGGTEAARTAIGGERAGDQKSATAV